MLKEADALTQDSQLQQVLLTHLPHAVISVAVAYWQGKLTPFIFLNVLVGGGKAVTFPFMRILVLSAQHRASDSNTLKAGFELAMTSMLRQTLGPTHPSTLASMDNYGATLGELGRHEEALAVQKEVCDLRAS